MAQKHQDWLSKIKNDGVNNISEMNSNHSLDLVIKEALRLVNPINISFGRGLIKDCEIQGVKLKKGSNVFTPIGFNRWNSQYIDAEKFRPDRFESEISELGKFAYIPFGEGKRKCLGYALGLMNMKILIGYLINKFELHVPEDQ